MVDAAYQDFLKVLEEILIKEGGAKYTDIPADYGGKTRWGITEKTARSWGYNGQMKDLPLDVAQSIYYKGYWIPSGARRVFPVSEMIARELMDIAVNLNPERSAGWLQRAINCLNTKDKNGKYRFGEDLKVDFIIGSTTINYLSKMTSRDLLVVFTILNMYQGNHYVLQAVGDERQRTFISGWLLQRVGSDILKVYKESKVNI
jgi:lysozyme family protein